MANVAHTNRVRGQPDASGSPAGGPDLESKVRFLRSPGAYDPRPVTVSVVETHMAMVFLTDYEAYKLKKPVRYPFLDFSTLEARETDSRDEVRLNRRLSPDVYLGVVALTQEPSGRLALNGTGHVVDWLVRMRRLPADRTLERVIAQGRLVPQDLERVGALLADFYAGLEPVRLDADAYVERFRSQQALNMELFRQFADDLDGVRLHGTAMAVEAFLERRQDKLRERVRQGRIVEGHGDLRPEHIYLTDPPAVLDCLEFNRFLRLVDPCDDVAYLGLECSLLGAGWVGRSVRQKVEARLGDHPDEELSAFYTVFRACLRARLALAHLTDSRPRSPERWPQLARRYLETAEKASDGLSSP